MRNWVSVWRGLATSIALATFALHASRGVSHSGEAQLPEVIPETAVSPTAETFTVREIAERVGPAVALLELLAPDESVTGLASGFFVDNTTLVTSLHAIDGAAAIRVRCGEVQTDEVTVLEFDVARDLVTLRVRGVTPPAIAQVGLASSLRAGDPLVVIGNPLGLERTITDGILSGWREPQAETAIEEGQAESVTLPMPQCRLMQLSAPISRGSSGGPVIDRAGKVVGVATAGVVYGAQNLNFAVPADAIEKLRVPGEKDGLQLTDFQVRADEVRLEIARPHYEESVLEYERRRTGPAARHLKRALALMPRFVEALCLQGRIQLENGALDAAQSSLRRALNANPDHAEGWFLLGRVHETRLERLGDLAELEFAESSYRTALDLDSARVEVALRLGRLLAGQKRWHDSAEVLRRAVAADSNSIEAGLALGDVLFLGEAYDEAFAAYDAVTRADARSARAYRGMGLCELVRMRTDLAARQFREYLRIIEREPDFEASVQEIRDLVAKFGRGAVVNLDR